MTPSFLSTLHSPLPRPIHSTNFNMRFNTTSLLLLLATGIDGTAVLRFGCSQITVERLDPYVPYLTMPGFTF